MAVRRLRIETDARTDEMPFEALVCRSMNHPWQRMPLSPKRRNALLKQGQTETVWTCLRCGSRRTDLYSLPDFTTLYSKIEYSDGYLVAKRYAGSGKLPRVEARKAMFMRDIQGVA